MNKLVKFYRLLADPAAVSRWYLKAPIDSSGNEVDSRVFTQGVPATTQLEGLIIPLRRKGTMIDFNFCDFDMVVTPAVLNAELAGLVGGGIQRIPVNVSSCDRDFEILNVIDLVDCVDEAASVFTKWTHEDGRPDKVGQYRMFARLCISAEAAAGHHLFRVREWPIALIASESVKLMFESRGVSGIRFDPVN